MVFAESSKRPLSSVYNVCNGHADRFLDILSEVIVALKEIHRAYLLILLGQLILSIQAIINCSKMSLTIKFDKHHTPQQRLPS